MLAGIAKLRESAEERDRLAARFEEAIKDYEQTERRVRVVMVCAAKGQMVVPEFVDEEFKLTPEEHAQTIQESRKSCARDAFIQIVGAFEKLISELLGYFRQLFLPGPIEQQPPVLHKAMFVICELLDLNFAHVKVFCFSLACSFK